MEATGNTAALLREATEQGQDISFSPPSLDEEGERAAGWLSEKISSTGASDAVATTNAVSPASGVATMGDAILRGMQSASQGYKKVSAEIHEALTENTGENLSLRSALELHMKFIEVSMEAEVVSRVVSKSTQHIDQLSKLQ